MLALTKRGRPHFVAQLSLETDSELKLRDKFYRICATLRYREVMALSRALGVHPRTVEAWKYKEKMPRWYTAMQVIDWDKRHRPLKLESPWRSAADML